MTLRRLVEKVEPERYTEWVLLWQEVHKIEGLKKPLGQATKDYMDSYRGTEHVIEDWEDVKQANEQSEVAGSPAAIPDPSRAGP